MRPSNNVVIDKMINYMTSVMDVSEILRYRLSFPIEYYYNIYQYGNLDIYGYDLYKRLIEFGVDTKAVKEYTKVLDFGCTYKYREDIRNICKNLVRRAVMKIITSHRQKQ